MLVAAWQVAERPVLRVHIIQHHHRVGDCAAGAVSVVLVHQSDLVCGKAWRRAEQGQGAASHSSQRFMTAAAV